MRILKNHSLLSLINGYLIDSPQPSNLSYLWNFGSLLAFCLVIQIVTGVTLAMHYNPSVAEAFNSVEHIMRDVNNGWLIRYLHSNTASAFLFLVYIHVGTVLHYASYKTVRTIVLIIHTIIVLIMATAFLAYVLERTQLSLCGGTIPNFMNAICLNVEYIIKFLWSEFSVNTKTLNRFFIFNFVLPFILATSALMHLIALHDSWGNPLGISGNCDRLPIPHSLYIKPILILFTKVILFILVMIVFFTIYYYFFAITAYCMDPETDARLSMEATIKKVTESYHYWKAQCIELELQFKESLVANDKDLQTSILEAKKESQRNLNTDSNLLRNLKQKYESGNFFFDKEVIVKKRSFSE